MTSTPTPEGTPTQIFIRFGKETDAGIECSIGTDGEDNAPRNTRMAMRKVWAQVERMCGGKITDDRPRPRREKGGKHGGA